MRLTALGLMGLRFLWLAHLQPIIPNRVVTLHDEVEIEDMEWSEELQAFTYQCPCGDLFQITLGELATGGWQVNLLLAQLAQQGCCRWCLHRNKMETVACKCICKQAHLLLLWCTRRGGCSLPFLLPLRAGHLRPRGLSAARSCGVKIEGRPPSPEAHP
jgi:hypothetical protein